MNDLKAGDLCITTAPMYWLSDDNTRILVIKPRTIFLCLTGLMKTIYTDKIAVRVLSDGMIARAIIHYDIQHHYTQHIKCITHG